MDHENIARLLGAPMDTVKKPCELALNGGGSICMTEMEPIAPGNPYLSDPYHMGEAMGKDFYIMMENHDSECCPYLILVNTKTGQRVKIDLSKWLTQEK